MCGIAGIYAFHANAPPVDLPELDRVRDYMAARGPDGFGSWVSENGRVGFAHRRLAIIDLSDRAAQPMVSADRSLVVTFNGEIYNYRVLRSDLERRGHVFRTQSDTEVLLALYAAKGRAMVDDLRGMFAFAIWDRKRGGVFLARDLFGIKPLYYATDGQTFRFASQVKALLAGQRLSRDPDAAGWVGFYMLGSVPEPLTTYRDIRTLPAGSTLWVDTRVGEPTSYCSVAEEWKVAESADYGALSVDEHEEIIRSGLQDSLRHHLIADVPVGLFLSSGIDSGTLAGMMHDLGQTQINAITMTYGEYKNTSNDEGPLAAKVAAHYGCNHTNRRVTEKEFANDIPKILECMDQPTIDGVNTWFVSKAAAERGLKVAISGIGGDELFGGYPSFRAIPELVEWVSRLPRWSALGDGVQRIFRKFSSILPINPKFGSLIKYGGTFGEAYYLMRGLFMPSELSQVLDDATIKEGLQRLNVFEEIRKDADRGPATPFAKIAALEASYYLRNQLLRDADWAGMAHSLEIRVPFVDRELLRRIGPSILAARKESAKQILARCPVKALPQEVMNRAKTGFTTPIDKWLQREPRLQRWRNVPELNSENCPWARRWAYQLAKGPTVVIRDTLAQRTSARDNREAVIIFRIGSIGDTVCALPCFHIIDRAFPNHYRILLTDITVVEKAAPVESIIGPSGLVDDVIYFPPPPRKWRDFIVLHQKLRATRATTLVYIAHRSLAATVRDLVFFRACGIKLIIGAPLTSAIRHPRLNPVGGEIEYEASRLVRSLIKCGPSDLDDPAEWDMHLQPKETAAARIALLPLAERDFIAINLGGKVKVKDWGDENWSELLRIMGARYGNIALVSFGSSEELARSEMILALWPGPTLNLCGRLSPRQSAAALARSSVFIGHDSGPMHMAAAMGVPCVCMFGEFNRPKQWHPYGARQRVIHNLAGVKLIAPDDVFAAVRETLESARIRASAKSLAVENG